MSDTVDLQEGRTADADGATTGDDFTGDDTSTERSRKGWWIAAAAAVVAGAAIVAVVISGDDATQAASTTDLATATVSETDLIVTEDLPGTLGFGAAEPLTYRTSNDGIVTVAGYAVGTVTDVASVGATVASGEVLYAVNSAPIVVLDGGLPAYRAFNSRMSDGPDVAQLEQALVDLGYDPDEDITIDEDFTSATGDAIERLQEAIGAEETGRLDVGDVVFASSPLYVATSHVDVGDGARAGEPAVSTSRAISGTVTSVADEGSIVGQGDELLVVDGEPVVLLIGSVPVYRAMKEGTSGDDVIQLQTALLELGYGEESGLEVNGDYDEATLDTVVDWQTAIGATPDGVVNVGDIFFLPEPIRVGENLVSVGDVVRDGTPILSSSVSSTFVTVQLSTDDQDLVAVGDQVVVELPAGTRESAIVTEIGTVVLATQQGETYFEMTVTLDTPDAAEGLDQAPVDVEVISDRANGVLSVPVTALLALAEGGYAVEVVPDSGSVYLIAVDPGLFADGFVEVTGAGLEAGMEVVVP
ncbi:MAG: peptidoglycan-binding protein [Actinomycetia bacterium]|nr:peptidoglycan-binding protein [Actinomycetes bacterium]